MRMAVLSEVVGYCWISLTMSDPVAVGVAGMYPCYHVQAPSFLMSYGPTSDSYGKGYNRGIMKNLQYH